MAAVLCATILGSGVAVAHDRDDDSDHHKPTPTVRPTPKQTVKPTATPKPTAAPTITVRPTLPPDIQVITPAIVIPRASTTPAGPQIISLPSTSTQ